MIVVADTTPLNYLILIGHIDILEVQYGRILIPHAVLDEMLDPNAPASVRAWAKNPPHWLEILSPSTARNSFPANLDPGETEAIQLAEELHSDWILIDEAAGRDEARRRGLQTIGTLGILRNAHALGLLDLRIALARLKESGFHMSETLVQTILDSIV
jgi:predicted nucleic acid-binding protein